MDNSQQNNENIEPIVEQPIVTTQPPMQQPPEVPAQKKSSKKILLLSIPLVLILLGVGVMLFIRSNDKETANSTVAEPTTSEAPAETNEDAAMYPIDSIAGIAGLSFEVPENWTTERSENKSDPNYFSYNLISPEVTSRADGYVDIIGGKKISIRFEDRDSSREAAYDEPWKTYVAGVGAPVVDDSVDFDSQQTDFSKIATLQNNNKVTMYYYLWSYEGCYVSVSALSEKTLYSFSIYSGDECLDPNVVKTDPEISSFIQSIKFVNDTPDVRAAADIYKEILNEKGTESTNPTIITTKDAVLHIFSGYADASTDWSLFNFPTPVVLLDSKQQLSSVLYGETTDYLKNVYTCDGCGFLSDVYKQTISLSTSAPQPAASATEISDDFFGSTKDIDPVSAGNTARRYTYTRKADATRYFTIEFTLETSTIEGSPQLPAITSTELLDTINAIKLL